MDSGTQQSIRAGQATPRLQKLLGDILTNSYELVASGGKVRGDKFLSGLMKINKLKVSEMKDVLEVRHTTQWLCAWLVTFQPWVPNSYSKVE